MLLNIRYGFFGLKIEYVKAVKFKIKYKNNKILGGQNYVNKKK